MATMTKKKLISTISQGQGLHPNHVRNVIQNFLDAMTSALANGDRLEFRDFGVLQVVERKPKIGRNPKIDIEQAPSGAVPLFKKGYFSWGQLPYPQEHAELGWAIEKLGTLLQDKKLLQTARLIKKWQQKILDHNKEPLFSLFLQEGK